MWSEAVVVAQVALLLVIARADILRMRVYPLHMLLLAATALLSATISDYPTLASRLAGAVSVGGIFALAWAGGRVYGRMAGAPAGTVVFGGGDVYLMAVCGLLLGFPAALFALALTVALGGVGALAVFVRSAAMGKYDRLACRMPYAVYVAAACIVALIARV